MNHRLLLDKLEVLVRSPKLCKWAATFLREHSPRVRVVAHFFPQLLVSSDVPKGSGMCLLQLSRLRGDVIETFKNLT